MPYVLSTPALLRDLRQNIRLRLRGGRRTRFRFLCSFEDWREDHDNFWYSCKHINVTIY